MSDPRSDFELLAAAGEVVDNYREAVEAEEWDELNPILFKRLASLVDARRGKSAYDPERLAMVAKQLARRPVKGKVNLEREDGIRQMLQDLLRLAQVDGCIAAGWALEAFCDLVPTEGADAEKPA